MRSPPLVVHVVVTANFAGTERYVCDVANETAGRGWDVAVAGGREVSMRAALHPAVRWRPGASVRTALRSLTDMGHCDVVHAHLTSAEAVAVAARRRNRGVVISTRHFAARRGSTLQGRLIAPIIRRRIDREIAISDYVASHLEQAPSEVILSGVPAAVPAWRADSKSVLVLQRLEREKCTEVALRAWASSSLIDHGWVMNIVGDGAMRADLEQLAASMELRGVEFVGHVQDVTHVFSRAGMLLATAPAEPFGLSVVEAMSRGVPVVATSSGGHLETIGRVPEAMLFRPGDAQSAGEALDRIGLDDKLRARLSEQCLRTQQNELTVSRLVTQLLAVYHDACDRSEGSRSRNEV